MRTRTVSFFLLVAALAATAGLAVACRDTATAPRGSARVADRAASLGSQARAAPGRDARAELHRANPMNWVGAAHNAALDAFLEELRKPGVLTKDMCGYILDFSTREERLPADRRAAASGLDASARRDVVRKALANTPLCRPAKRSASVPGDFLRLAHLPGAEAGWSTALWRARGLAATPTVARQSSAAYDLLWQIESAIDAAVDSYDLAARLHAILNAAASLPYEEYATVAATVSVAQSSYEYWPTAYPGYVEAIERDYGACIDEVYYAGYSSYDAMNYCMGGSDALKSYTGLRRPGGRPGGEPVALMFVGGTAASSQECTSTGAGLRQIGRGDARGAFTGAFTGAFVGGVQGAVLGGILGGAGLSIYTAIELAVTQAATCGSSGARGSFR